MHSIRALIFDGSEAVSNAVSRDDSNPAVCEVLLEGLAAMILTFGRPLTYGSNPTVAAGKKGEFSYIIISCTYTSRVLG